jgi:hypothetical protein
MGGFDVRSLPVAYILWGFVGVLGVHRFYLGRIGTGILWLLTGGLFGIGWIVDAFLIPDMVRQANYDPFCPPPWPAARNPATPDAAPPRVRRAPNVAASRTEGAAPGYRIIYCTFCGNPLQVPLHAVGTRYACPSCHTVLVVPG